MNYPLLSEYVESIKLAEDNLDKLSYLRPVLNNDGNPIMSSGNFAVVFKMRSEKDGRYYALKCFIKDQEGRNEAYKLIADELEYVSSEYLLHVRYLEKELFVDTTSGSDTEFPVLLMDWVEGVTLDKWIRQHLYDRYSLQLITYQFCRMASWLMSQPFAHGDLKPDNIIVHDVGSLVLVDYDGMYVPAMQGQKSRELGSPDYRHPARTAEDFNEHIDDFSLAAIAMQLAAIALDPGLFANQNGDTLLLAEADHRDLANSSNHHRLYNLFHNADFERLYALYLLAHAQQTLSNVSFRAFLFPKPEKPAMLETLSTKITDEDINSGVKDEYGALYSSDGLRLLKGIDIERYQIRQGTKIICDSAFSWCFNLSSITIPDSVTHIGANPFAISGVRKIKCDSLLFEVDEDALYSEGKKTIIAFLNRDTSKFTIPHSVTHIGDRAFWLCHSLSSITIPDSVTHIGDKAFWLCHSLSSITIPDSVTHIGDSAFDGCIGLLSIFIPHSVTHIGDRAFSDCSKLSSITIPDSVTHIGANPFAISGVRRIECKSPFFVVDEHALYTEGKKTIIAFFNRDVSEFTIPDSVTHIGDRAFMECENLTSITIPDSVTHIGNSAFDGCIGLLSIFIPHSVTHIGDRAFSDCSKLSSITIPDSVTHIGANPFAISGVRKIKCDSFLFEVDEYALYSKGKKTIIAFFNRDSEEFTIPHSVTHIGDRAFMKCDNLTSITIPKSVTHIGDYAFSGCERFSSISIPDSVTHIGDSAFNGCDSLSSITIPESVIYIGNGAFSWCKSLYSISIPYSVTHIGDRAFERCGFLFFIIIPLGSRTKFERMLPHDLHNKLKEQ